MDDQNFYDAFVAVFSLIAFADQELHKRETIRFISHAKKLNLVKAKTSLSLQADLETFTNDLESNFEKARKQAISRIQKVSAQTGTLERLMELAQTAIVADDKIQESEEQMMIYICKALEIDPKKYTA